ncbi:hypothetical protein GB931_11740 [Modestobacter sp. I12A-02628]|uniref:Secreted protein n=1 Tax=Goekera deserti TaxID=2497753 RepID=A0A7K3WCQ5_9ACTN|nr:hypothetical protein [Goekera deserti]MPQ98578.1 hypothetical protein [Goekera deserti]NDI49052.1 hypothetical protein [Goekera deserti]NEL54157.1 hypothetical protein [Goekera deserti]
MRTSHVATAVAALTAGLTAAAALRGMSARRQLAVVEVPSVQDTGHDAVVLPFTRPVLVAPVAVASGEPVRCGDTGGLTRAGAPCAARAGSSGRCHHHALAA